MDDLEQKLNAVLSDPDALEKIRNLASGILGEGDKSASPQPPPAPDPDNSQGNDIGNLLSNLGSGDLSALGDISGIMNMLPLISKIKSCDDERSRLIAALRPFLSKKRQRRADTAMKILRIMDILPVLQQNGLLDKLI